MAVKKSDLYSSLWKSCDELRGRIDAIRYRLTGRDEKHLPELTAEVEAPKTQVEKHLEKMGYGWS